MREVAKRVFAREYAESEMVVREGNTEYAPSYVVTPTGAKCNRLFVSGVLTEIEKVGDDETYRARISDPTGQFLVFAGEYQPEAAKFLSEAEVPSFVSIYGKTNIYRPDEETVITSIRPESINYCQEIDRDRWVVKTALRTLKRLKDIDKETKEHYGTNKNEYKEITIEALEITVGADKTGEKTTAPTEKTQEETEETPEDTAQEPSFEEKGFEEASQHEVDNDLEEDDEVEEEEDDELDDEFLEEIISGGNKKTEAEEDTEEENKGIEEWDLSGS